jgi:hypothetical protein
MRGVAALLVAFVVIGASVGVGAHSEADAELTVEELGYDKGDAESEAMAEVTEGAMYYFAMWLNEVSVWAYRNPGEAYVVMVGAPVLLIAPRALMYLAKAGLIVYVGLEERRARREESQ